MSVASAPQRSVASTPRPQSGPPLLVPALAFAALTAAYIAVNSSTPHPDASGAAVLHYAQTHTTIIKVGATLLFGSAVPLALCAAIFYRRLRALGITAPGSAITLVGGVLAAGAMTLCAMFTWTGSRLPADASPALARAIADMSFMAGGPGYVVMFALFAAGISVTGLIAGLLPRAVTWVGLVLAAVGMVATLSLLASGFSYLMPVVRFGGTVWLVFVAALLPRTRARTTPPAPPAAAS